MFVENPNFPQGFNGQRSLPGTGSVLNRVNPFRNLHPLIFGIVPGGLNQWKKKPHAQSHKTRSQHDGNHDTLLTQPTIRWMIRRF
jgi:hypothetical protein